MRRSSNARAGKDADLGLGRCLDAEMQGTVEDPAEHVAFGQQPDNMLTSVAQRLLHAQKSGLDTSDEDRVFPVHDHRLPGVVFAAPADRFELIDRFNFKITQMAYARQAARRPTQRSALGFHSFPSHRAGTATSGKNRLVAAIPRKQE